MNLVIPTWIAGLLACGMGVALLGSVKVALARKLKIDEARVGGLVSMFGFAMIPVMLVMGFLADKLDKKLVVIAGSLLIVASLLVLSRATKYVSALFAVLLLSAGWSALVIVLNALMQPAFGGAETSAMNLGNFFFGLGAFLTPLVIALLIGHVGLTRAMLILAVLAVACGALAAGVNFDDFGKAAAKPVAGELAAPDMPGIAPPLARPTPTIGMLLSEPVLWLCALALVFYAPLEATMAAWATTYLGEKGLSEGSAARLLSAFWLAFMASRLLTAVLVIRFPIVGGSETLLIVALALLCVLMWMCVVWSRSRGMAIAMVVGAGLVYGPVFPTLVGVLLGPDGFKFQPTLAGRAVGVFFAVGGIGWTLIPMAIGAYARRTSIQRGFRVALAAAMCLFMTTVALAYHVLVGQARFGP